MKTHDSLGRVRRASQSGAGPKHLPDKKNARKCGAFDPKPPEELGAAAVTWWKWAVKTMETMGYLDAADRGFVIMAARTVQRYSDAVAYCKKNQEYYTDAHGNMKRNPALVTLEKAEGKLHSFYSDLGLTPSARVKFGPGNEEEDPFEELTKRARAN